MRDGPETEHIRSYYDRHTAGFVSLGQRGSNGAIHRAVWGPGVRNRRQAFRFVENRIAALLRGLPPAFDASRLVDLGCGVGASLCYLAERLPIRGTGITLSPVQARFAAERIRKAGIADRIDCIEGDYCDLPTRVGLADFAYAIESFVHGSTPERFFAECSRIVRPGGLLLICDDFRRSAAGPAAAPAIERFRRGWRVNTLIHRDELRSLARAAGFEHVSTSDLTAYLEIRRMRDRAADAMLALLGWHPWVARRFDYVSGGSALQTCLANGWIGYDLALFRRSG